MLGGFRAREEVDFGPVEGAHKESVSLQGSDSAEARLVRVGDKHANRLDFGVVAHIENDQAKHGDDDDIRVSRVVVVLKRHNCCALLLKWF